MLPVYRFTPIVLELPSFELADLTLCVFFNCYKKIKMWYIIVYGAYCQNNYQIITVLKLKEVEISNFIFKLFIISICVHTYIYILKSIKIMPVIIYIY